MQRNEDVARRLAVQIFCMPSATVHHFFVDEAGDLTLVDRRKRLVLGREGVSSTFIVGAALVEDQIGVAERLGVLRARLLADPLLAGAASMQPDAGRTAVAFHANKDLPEVRLKVFRQLMREEIRVFAAIRRKHRLADEVREFQVQTNSKLDMESVYESLVERVFRDRLHLAEETRSVFERGEGRFFDAVHQHFGLIVDVDDTRNHPYGEYYSARNPLTQKKLLPGFEARPK